MFNKKKVLFVFGTRPEAVKMAPLILACSKSDKIVTEVCVTAQHRKMLDQILEWFDITPDYDLDIMKQHQDLFDITSNVILGLKGVLQQSKPDVVLVHGDTTTSFAASLAAFYSQIAVGHVEAGLRTNDIYSPFPEEMNRQLTSRIAMYNFCPTILNKENLLKEQVDPERIFVTGNSVIDALLWTKDKIEEKKISFEYAFSKELLQIIKSDKKKVLVTAHRRESFGDGFINICAALKSISEQVPDAEIIYPVHLNPNVKQPVFAALQGCSNIHLIEPLEYQPFIYLMNACSLILTDSGGVQEEAPSLHKKVLVMRDVTERMEAVNAGTVELVGTNKDQIIEKSVNFLKGEAKYEEQINPYGDGLACQRILEVLLEKLNLG